jgi:TolB-like protein/Flp pilus assembly protein TadD
MKRCPDCRRDYHDDSLMYCLEDGTALVQGSVPSPAEPQTAILPSAGPPREAATLAHVFTTEPEPVDPGRRPGEEGRHTVRAVKPLIAALVVALIGAGGFLVYRYTGSAANGQIDSIAVLPFENRSESADAEYLSDGLSESLIYRLSQLPDLKVSPTSSVMQYKGKGGNLAAIASELGVRAVMTGKLVQRGDNLTISIELIDVANNKLLWGEQYERRMADLLATQREIATAITQKLQLKLTGDEKGITKKYTDNNEAYQLYLKGRYHFARRTKNDINKAISSYEQAIGLDPNFALAYARIAEAYNQMSNYPYASPREAFPKAKAAAERAIAIDPTLSEAHTAMGNTLTSFDWNWAEAEKSFRRALELDPNSATGHYRFATEYLMPLGRTKEAVAEVERALEIEPLDPNMVANLPRAFLYNGESERALEQSRKAYEADQNFVIARLLYGLTLNAAGKYSEAIELSEKQLENDPFNQHMLLVAGYAYGRSGNREKALAVVERFREISRTEYVIPSFVAAIYGAAGEKEMAFAELEKGVDVRDSWFKWGKVEPLFDTLRGDPRFGGLLRRMNLPE